MFYYTPFVMLLTICLQLFAATTRAAPLPQVTDKTAISETDCSCNRTNLTMMVDGHFLHKWLKFNTHHSIRHLSEAAGNLADNTEHLQVSTQY